MNKLTLVQSSTMRYDNTLTIFTKMKEDWLGIKCFYLKQMIVFVCRFTRYTSFGYLFLLLFWPFLRWPSFKKSECLIEVWYTQKGKKCKCLVQWIFTKRTDPLFVFKKQNITSTPEAHALRHFPVTTPKEELKL